VGDFVDCDSLCGSSSTAVRCDAGEGGLALTKIAELERWAWESTERVRGSWDPHGGYLRGCWRWSDLTSENAAELLNFPSGVPSMDPPVAVRASLLPDGRVHLSQYIHATEVFDECTLRLGIAVSWTPIDMEHVVVEENLEMSFLLLEKSGNCHPLAQTGISWKYDGWLLHPAPLYLPDFQDIACSVDGHCVEECRVDYDCPCHFDERCDPVGCVGDAECACVADGHCIPGCDDDPDCACARDGECNRLCLSLDPDCPCEADECCSWECLSQDPDCGCGEDGACSAAPCGWFDPDCICGDDGLCNEVCGDGKDPDCGEER